MYRVILVDDERLILRGLSTVIPWEEMNCEIAGTAHDGVSGLELIRKVRPEKPHAKRKAEAARD